MKHSKRDLAAIGARYSGLTSLLGLLPRKPGLLVLNYHRIGDRETCPYDAGVFSGTADELDDQVRFLKRRFHMATLQEAMEIAEGSKRPPGTAVLLTFDDGYLDNHDAALPILASHGVQGVFFLPTSYIGTNRIPWWDAIAAVVKRGCNRTFQLSYPSPQRFDVDAEGVERVVERVLWTYKSAGMEDAGRFLSMLEDACGAARPGNSERCFVTWDEAAAMLRGGMAIGSHAHTHEILAKLPQEEQVEELTTSKRILEERLGTPVHALSYPVGHEESFSAATREAASEAGYRVAFSFYGGYNRFGAMDRFDVRRYPVSPAARARFRLQTSLAAVTSGYWF
jgi:peptidoglycan/xylan/chitin deacetylase (PgdA/CDA1 family)